MKHKSTAFAAVIGAAALALSACGSAPDSGSSASPSSSGSAQASNFQGCMVTDQGGIDDRSFNASAWKGLNEAKDARGIKVKYVTSKSEADYVPNVNSLVAEDCGIIVTVGFSLGDATKAAAKANANEKFAIVDENPDATATNIKPLLFNTAEASYLAGYLAAGMTKTGTVATFGGIKLPSVAVFMDGFVDGVAKYNADNGKTVKVLGWDKAKQDGSFAGAFNDQAKGKTLALNFIQQGADIILPVAGQTGLGAGAAAKETGKANLIWVDSDGFESVPQYKDLIMTSVVKQIDVAVKEATLATVDGQFDPKPFIGTLDNQGVGLAPYHNFDSTIPQALKDKITELSASIAQGDLKVESTNSPKAS